MNFLDLLIAIPLGYLIFKGFRRGLIFECASLAGVILGLIVAIRMADRFATLVGLEGKSTMLVAFFILFVAVVILALFAGKLAERAVKLMHLGIFNNLAGALLGMTKGVVIVGVLLYFISVIDLKERVLTTEAKQQSMLYQPVENAGIRLAGKYMSKN